MREVVKSLRGHYGKLVIVPLLKLSEAVLELMVPLVVAQMINVGIQTGDRAFLLSRGGILLAIAVAGILSALVGQYYAAQAAADVGRVLRRRLFSHVGALSYEQTGAVGQAKLINLITGDVLQIQTGLNLLTRLGARVPFLGLGSVVMALMLNFRIGLIFLATVTLLVIMLTLIIRHILPAFAEVQIKQDDLGRLGRENLAGVRVIRAFNRQDAEATAFAQAASGLTNQIVKVGRVGALVGPLSSVLIHGAVLATIWIGARHTYLGLSNPGEIVALVSYMGITMLSIMVAVHLTIVLTRTMTSVRRIEAVLQTEPAIADGPGAAPEPDAATLEFDGVTFAYHKGARAALSGLSFTLRPGETLGVIGGTGSGKSTLAGLCLRLTDAQTGQVRFGGTPVTAYKLSDLRGRMGFVPQKAALFTGSVAHNLRMAASHATEDEMWAALEVAQAADFVRELPEGVETEIRQGGVSLSGGQRQRLNIARALLGRPALLILDDASSALDYMTDAALGQALRAWREDTAVVLISQRAASMRHADQILVLEDGQAVGQGSHQTLLETCTVYQEICRSQGLHV